MSTSKNVVKPTVGNGTQNDLPVNVTVMPLSKLCLWKKNPRLNDSSVPRLAELLKVHGQRTPVVVWENNWTIYKGNTIYKAMRLLHEQYKLKKLNLDDVCSGAEAEAIALEKHGHNDFASAILQQARDMRTMIKNGWIRVQIEHFRSESAAAAYAIADNKSSEFSEWDDNALRELLQSDDVRGYESFIGFDKTDMKKMSIIDNIDVGSKINMTKEDRKNNIIVITIDEANRDTIHTMLEKWADNLKLKGISFVPSSRLCAVEVERKKETRRIAAVNKAMRIIMSERTSLNVLSKSIIKNEMLTVTNLDDWLSIRVPGIGIEGAVDNKLFMSTNGDMELCSTTIDQEAYPKLDIDNKHTGEAISIDSTLFLHDLSIIGKAASDNIVREALTGVHFDAENQMIVATDGHWGLWRATNGLPISFIVKPKTLYILRALTDVLALHSVKISGDKKYIIFSGNDFTLTSKLIDEVYPNFLKAVPTAIEHSKTLVASEVVKLAEAVSRLSHVAPGENKLIICDDRKLTVRNSDIEKTISVNLPFDFISVRRGINADRLYDTLQIFLQTGCTVNETASAVGAVLFESTSNGITSLVMPLRITD